MAVTKVGIGEGLTHDDKLSGVVGVDEPLARLGRPAETVEACEAVLPVLLEFFDRR